MNDRLAPVHPGEVLQEEFLKPFNLSKYRLAKELHVPATRIGEIIDGKRAVTADTALRLSRFFGTSAEFWINLQGQYDIEVTEQKEHDQLESVHRKQAPPFRSPTHLRSKLNRSQLSPVDSNFQTKARSWQSMKSRDQS